MNNAKCSMLNVQWAASKIELACATVCSSRSLVTRGKGSAGNPAAAENQVILVKDRRLAGGNSALSRM